MMNKKSTIKPSLLYSKISIGGILFLIFFILEGKFFGTQFTLFIWGGFLVTFGFYYFYKVNMIHFLVVGTLLGTAVWHFVLADSMQLPFSDLTFYLHLFIALLSGAILLPKMDRAIRLEISARQLFKLASQQVYEMSHGFTNRPYTGGKTNAERKDILGLARYLAGENIVVFESDPEVITYAFSMNTSPLAVSQLKKVSYIAFDKEENISIHISERNYRQYKNQLSFDQLCASFATLFKQFLEYYKDGNEERIKNELKSV
ncbi:MAG: hypothetical protein K8R74_17045 [Bacteroidales bacterium]|nr:hypothetical protein [Bacteroidales bacterium]